MGLPRPVVEETSEQVKMHSNGNCSGFEGSSNNKVMNGKCTFESGHSSGYTNTFSCLDSEREDGFGVSPSKKIGMEDEKYLSKWGLKAVNPVTRVIGFSSPDAVIKDVAVSDGCLQVHIPLNCSDVSIPQARKRTLSPLNDMLSSSHGGTLSKYVEIEEKYSEAVGEEKSEYRFDTKKANCTTSPYTKSLSIPRISGWGQHRNIPIYQTDGPLLDEKNSQNEFCEKVFAGRVIAPRYSRSPPLHSLSPLGPKNAERVALKHHDSVTQGHNKFGLWKGESKNSNVEYEAETCLKSGLDERFRDSGKAYHEVGFVHRDLHGGTSSKTVEDWPSCPKFGSAPASSAKLNRSLSSLPIRRSLVGSFEESLLSGRFSAGRANQTIEGFLAVLSVTGGSFSTPSRRIPFSVNCIDADSTQLYYASVDLAGGVPQSKPKCSRAKKSSKHEDSRASKSRFRIPVKGRIQLVLSNPEKTPVHTFMCNYDLNDMPPGTKTFMRHKVTLASNVINKTSPNGTNAFTLKKNPSIHDGHGALTEINSQECTYANVSKKHGNCNTFVNSVTTSPGFSILGRVCEGDGTVKRKIDEGNLIESLNLSQCNDILRNDFHSIDITDRANKSRYTSSQNNGNISVSGALRYALHLRFLCPSIKKGSNNVLTNSSNSSLASSISSDSMKADDQRRFYLYNDLRVVFPQRHSDADEGKLQVEYHFPEDPKYFEYCS